MRRFFFRSTASLSSLLPNPKLWFFSQAFVRHFWQHFFILGLG
ncbi:hypothetical protein C4K34_2469 [Pseudomonas chlororaphis subsp. piscium]|nr:hypothetical protein C4K34_2469 [Pseudomonas chlororaphis subsp. piscium]AZC62851.1 hypothetical protein C4K33_2359 [Pseudomonas chlororaphis subsp. piscium]AZC69087.1 hypothetical protein C4K32_2425 [Pseudomonas chlororaphis subsp. piscium]AZC75270.1 hypothetical protein C4K31_2367 [Pseudomonas chlororaphis subsp. piscium]AZC81541.1 hypothetical protein C4K30_2427 [Pseudomonas chlororaphis subsp. piscium]